MRSTPILGVILALFVAFATAQLPPRRLQIPGAIPLGGPQERPLPIRRQQPLGPPLKLRRPLLNAIPAPQQQIRPVVEEQDDLPTSSLNLNEEVARLSQIQIQQPTPRQQLYDEEDEDDQPAPRPYIPPVQFRPERPPIQVAQPVRNAPQPQRQPQQTRAQVRQPSRPAARPQYADESDAPRQRPKKPVSQILRKYRDDNPDGSITWGFENDDGTFKEETIGTDCVTRGKYGYIDPDGNRREYTYETGLKCDHREEELPEEVVYQQPQAKLQKRPLPVRLQ